MVDEIDLQHQGIAMIKATVSELRSSFSQISKWLELGETVQIIKGGKPFARIIPEKIKRKSFLGACPGLIPLPADIDDPVPHAKKSRLVASFRRNKPTSLKSLVTKITPKNVHPEIGWGRPQGKEVW
jgi:antitoxin (DNA-binding transcriptional repressor) of toxin-antitoxin stability system